MKTLEQLYSGMRAKCDKSLIKGRDLQSFNTLVSTIREQGLEVYVCPERRVKTTFRNSNFLIVSSPLEPRNYDNISLGMDGNAEDKKNIMYSANEGLLGDNVRREGRFLILETLRKKYQIVY